MVDVREAFAAWRKKHARRAWKPVCVDGIVEGAQFGGAPWMAAGDPWPTCAGCKTPMQFFLQIPRASLPAGFAMGGEGLLQMFYCSVDDGDCETYRPFSGTHAVLLRSGSLQPRGAPPGLRPFPARSIVRWSELVDYPHSEEHAELGLVYEYDFAKKTVNVSCPELGVGLRGLDLDDDVAETIGDAADGDKLGGWPHWIQSVEYPECPECDRRMELVLQIDSEENVPHMFGDAGCGHLTQCPDHPQVLAFGWACS